MRTTLSSHLKLTMLLLVLGLSGSPAIAEPEHRRLLDKDHLKGDFGPAAGQLVRSEKGPIHNWPLLPGKKGIPADFRQPDRRMWGDFGPYTHQAIPNHGVPSQGIPSAKVTGRKLPGPQHERKSATDINHLRKAKDGRWLFKSIEDEKLFLLLPREKVKELLGVPRKDTGGLIEYNCRLGDSPGYLELFIRDEQVRSSKIWIEETYRQSKRK